jgi:8-oxo-dGTP diphosphatase
MSVDAIKRVYGERLRIRVCGLCFSGEDLLLVRHKALTRRGYFFSPPGGGMQFGESAEECLIREFYEETGLSIIVNKFLFIHEFLSPPLHAIELFFAVEAVGGALRTGLDPEMNMYEQIIESVKFMSPISIKQEKGYQMHQMLNLVEQPKDLLNRQGYFKFADKSLK